jgi:hypothetical protein
MSELRIITKPAPDEYPEWFAAEIEPVPYNDLLTGLSEAYTASYALLSGLDEEQLLFRYQEGKWTIREMWQHMLDVERVLSYRALRYARNDKTVLTGFDQEDYAIESRANKRRWSDMMEEYTHLRMASISLFNSFDGEMQMRRGTAGRSELTVRAIGYLVLGHDMHHLETVKNKYLLQHK